MANTRDIRRRIKSIQSTKKVTKAMEMVSSAKMRKAVNGVLATRPYASLAWDLITNVAGKTSVELHPLLHKREEIKRIGLIILSSNRGLCGSFNQQIVRISHEYLKEARKENPGVEVELIAMGRKGARGMIRLGYNVVADFEKQDVVSEAVSIRPLAKMIIKDYLEGKYDKVVVVYTDFLSMLRQVPRVKQILPIENFEMSGEQRTANSEQRLEYLFEPTPEVILNDLLPRLLEVQVFQSLLESNASEHSARMMSMRNASDAAGDMINELTLTYNQARQAAITKEIAEIAGGKAALE